MQKNVLIGIGGTGSRVIESVLHLCAAGLGPDKLHIFMIDPDRGNGNLTRTQSLIKKYTELRDKFQKAPDMPNPCFKTEIIIPEGDEPFVWSIFEDSYYTLGKYINYDNIYQNNRDLADLANVLFTDQELKTSLERGFRGHPSIGAVVMANPPMDEYPFKLLWDGTESLGENELRVYIVGSIFGGTGAAGFPTLGAKNLIKYNDKAKLGDNKSKVLLGGALVLPYFSFSVENTANEAMFVTASDFPIATKAALQYYNDKELGFDQYYLIGDSLSQKVGKFSTGASTQNNQPHYIELVSGLAAFDFFNQEAGTNLAEKKYFIASRENEQVDWSTLPLTRNSGKKLISDFTIFSYAYLTFGKSILSKTHKDVSLESWYSMNFKSQYKEDSELYNPRHNVNIPLYETADQYLNSFLYWICSIDDQDIVKLIDKTKIISGDIPDDKKLKLLDPEFYKGNIGHIIKEDGQSSPLDFNAFRARGLEVSTVRSGTLTAGSIFLNIFYNAASEFNKQNSFNS
jgi:hypothetical protein